MHYKNKKIFIIAGEMSGENIIYNILKYKNFYKDINLYGIGSCKLKQLGLKSIFPMEELSLMGIFEILPKIPKLLSLINKTVSYIHYIKPDLIITIDSPDFNFRVLNKVKKTQSYKTLHIVAPSVWAWKPNRAKKIKKYIDYLFTLYPFEKKLFIKHGIETKFIGHPVVEEKKIKKPIFKKKKVISIYPGSRKSEIVRHLPLIIKTLVGIKNIKNYSILFIAVDIFYDLVQSICKNKNYEFDMKVLKASKYKRYSFKVSDYAIAVSGTITLELFIHRIPMIAIYRMTYFSFLVIKQLVMVKYISIINIIFNKEIIPELIQGNLTKKNLNSILLKLLSKKKIYTQQLNYFKKAHEKLTFNGIKPSLIANKKIKDIIYR